MSPPFGWLLLIHQLPPRPLYLRAQVRRRLAQVGALPLKNSVYVLPDTAACLEDFQWIAQEAVASGGEATVCRAAFVGSTVATELQSRFLEAAASRFAPIKAAVAKQLTELRRRKSGSSTAAATTRVQRMADEAMRLDFFQSDAGKEVQTLMSAIRKLLQPPAKAGARDSSGRELKGRVWVTRRDPHIDRLATAWLIRRFVDPAARFRFVDPAGGEPARPGEKSFDMIGADFTHEGDRCSFETMCVRLNLKDPALGHLAEIVHDLDLKDSRFGRPDAAGVQRLVEGLSAAHADSNARVTAALPIFDTLFASFGGRLPRATRHGAAARTASRSKARR